MSKHFPAFTENPVTAFYGRKWMTLFVATLVFLLILALISINIHGEMGGANRRF